MCLHNIASLKSTAGNKTRLFLSPFFISTTWFLVMAEAFRNDHVAACSTALRSATEKNEKAGDVTIPFSRKRHSVVAQRYDSNSCDITRLVTTEHIRNKFSLLKSRSVIVAVIDNENLLTLSIQKDGFI